MIALVRGYLLRRRAFAALLTGILFSLSLAGALPYSTRIDEAFGPEEYQARLLNLLNDERHKKGLSVLILEPGACRVAEDHSQLMSFSGEFEFTRPGVGSLAFRLQEAGVPDYFKLFNILKVSRLNMVVPQMLKAKEPNLLNPVLTHAGIGAVKVSEWWVTFIFLERAVEIEDFPRRVTDPEKAVKLEGELLRSYSVPEVKVAFPGGKVSSLEVLEEGRRFSARVAFPEGSGQYVVEILATGGMGEVVAALLPVFAGVAVPSPEETPPEKETRVLDIAEMEQEMVRLVNEDRKRQGAGPVTIDERLRGIARSHSRAMASVGTAAHELPGSPGLEARLRDTRILAVKAGENISRDRSIASAQTNLMASPGHRQTMLEPSFTHVGIGITRGKSGDLFITQDFIAEFKAISPETLRARVLEILNKEREEKGLEPLEEDERLKRIAEGHTGKMVSRDEVFPPTDLRNQALKARVKYRAAVAEVYSGASADVVGQSQSASEKKYNKVGVGALQTARSRRGVGVVWVTVICADLP